MNIEEKVVYCVGDKTFTSYVEAEAAVVDMLGEHIDGLFKSIDTGDLRYTAHSKMLIQLVEKLWETRSELLPILLSTYVPSEYIERRIEEADCPYCQDR